jgi:Fur family transcriptional regulator, ferric uptake regulator
MPNAEHVLARLAAIGYRETAPRRAIVDLIADRSSSFTAQDLYEELDRRGIGRATVFRTLNLLHDMGLVNRIHTGDGCHRYTLCEPVHHHHLVCNECGQVFPLDGCPVEKEVQSAANAVAFQILGHHVEVFGLCADCIPKA